MKAAIDASEGDSLAEAKGFEEALDRVGGEDGIGRAYLAPRALSEAGGAATSRRAPGCSARSRPAPGDGIAADGVGGEVPRRRRGRCAPTSRASAAPSPATRPTPRCSRTSPGRPGWPPASARSARGCASSSSRSAPRRRCSACWAPRRASTSSATSWTGWARARSSSSATPRATLGGALVVQSKDPAATRAAIPKLSALIGRFANGVEAKPLRAAGVDEGITLQPPGAPTGIHIAAAGDLFVIAAGDEALKRGHLPQLPPRRRRGLQGSRRDARRRPAADDLRRRRAPSRRARGRVRQERARSVQARRSSASPPLVAADRGEGAGEPASDCADAPVVRQQPAPAARFASRRSGPRAPSRSQPRCSIVTRVALRAPRRSGSRPRSRRRRPGAGATRRRAGAAAPRRRCAPSRPRGRRRCARRSARPARGSKIDLEARLARRRCGSSATTSTSAAAQVAKACSTPQADVEASGGAARSLARVLRGQGEAARRRRPRPCSR